MSIGQGVRFFLEGSGATLRDYPPALRLPKAHTVWHDGPVRSDYMVVGKAIRLLHLPYSRICQEAYFAGALLVLPSRRTKGKTVTLVARSWVEANSPR